ncbi:hypothetical protein SAY86_001075 [Trapa natans]|uniref:Uncharacterized protein n=1 Tax=Trapa natans TaxID=22666 RepID=A0AAN7MD39_TRANT|nr:hypothetical protein SAY86_001075 [Trapa natans]
MSLFRRRALAFLDHPNSSTFISYLDVSKKRCIFTSFFWRTDPSPPESESISSAENPKVESPKKMKRMSDFFKESLGLSPRSDDPADDEGGTSDLGRELKQLETRIRRLNVHRVEVGEVVMKTEGKEKPVNIKAAAPKLSSLFTKRRGAWGRLPEASVTLKMLSPETEMFLNHLHNEGYFNGASFMRNGKLESDWYMNDCGRDFIKSATDKFGKDHKEIAKYLLSSELKKVAFFGCPSVASKTTSAAKRLRVFFSIPEDTVCSRCALRSSCRFVNQQLGTKNAKMAKNELNLIHVLRVIILYALELVPPALAIPDELKVSSNRLLRHILELSSTTTKVEVKI